MSRQYPCPISNSQDRRLSIQYKAKIEELERREEKFKELLEAAKSFLSLECDILKHRSDDGTSWCRECHLSNEKHDSDCIVGKLEQAIKDIEG